MEKKPLIDGLRLDGGVLCLDFVNTIPDRNDGSDRDLLANIGDLIYWARKTKVVDHSTAAAMDDAGKNNDRKAKDFFRDALELRTLVYSLFLPIANGHKVNTADLSAFNKWVVRYAPALELNATRDGFVEQWNFEPWDFRNITAPIVKSAHELLLSAKLQRIKECPSCGWLFVDTTKNGKRRWCSMEDCGSNAKALEYYYRKKKEGN